MDKDKLLRLINESKNYLKSQSLESQNRVASFELTSILVNMLVLDFDQNQPEDFLYWVHFAENYFYQLNPSKDRFAVVNNLYLDFKKYILSIVKGSPDLNLVESYANIYSEYIFKNYKLNKSDSDLYEKVVMIWLETKQYDKFCELSKKILSIKERSTLSIIMAFSFEKTGDNPELLIKKFKTFLKRRKDELLEDNYFYFSYYFREMLKVDSTKEVLKALVLGLD